MVSWPAIGHVLVLMDHYLVYRWPELGTARKRLGAAFERSMIITMMIAIDLMSAGALACRTAIGGRWRGAG